MRKRHSIVVLAACPLMSAAIAGAADVALNIEELQSNTVDGDISVYDGQVVDCVGGIVVGKFSGSRPRIILEDPLSHDAWAAIQVKDWTAAHELFGQVDIGDRVSLRNVLVEEYRGTTILQWQAPNDPGYTVVSHNNAVPPPRLVDVAEIAAPIEHPFDEWYVQNHDAEPYESMRVIVRDVTVTRMNLGKAVDNYNLRNAEGDDCWAADYMNAEVEPSAYHRFVTLGRHFCAVGGTLEQYTHLANGWDYYQIVTMTTADLNLCGDGDHDGDVDLADLPRFRQCLSGARCDDLADGCRPPAWTGDATNMALTACLMMDQDFDGDVDLHDFARLQELFETADR